MTTERKRPRDSADALAEAAAKDKGKAPVAKAKGNLPAATALAANDDGADRDASSSDITSSSSSAYSSDTSGDDEESASDDTGSDEDAENDDKGVVNVDFEFYDPGTIDFLGLKMLLNTWLDGLEFDCSGLCDALIAQRTVGTVLKTEEGGDPIGILSCLDARRARSARKKEEGEGGGGGDRHVPALAQLERYLLSCAPSASDAERVKAAFPAGTGAGGEKGRGGRHTGVVVSERLLNVPPAVAQPLHEALFDEIAWATEDEPTQELKESFEFGQFLVFSRVYLDDSVDGDGGGDGGDDDLKGAGKGEEEEDGDESEDGDDGGKRKKKKARAPPSTSPTPVVVFVRPEDQFFAEAAQWSFVFEPPPLPESSDRHRQPQRRGELRRARLVALVAAERVREVREKLREAVGGAV